MKRTILVGTMATLLLFGVAVSASARVKSFQSPSKNIGCVIFTSKNHGSGARCDIGHRTWSAGQKPHSCHEDYGNGLQVTDHGKGRYVCAGDTVLGQGPVLDYGDSAKLGDFKCTSRKADVHCINRQTDHGFRISVQSAGLF